MTTPSFTLFRSGTPISLTEGKQLNYAELKKTGLPDFYLRIIHEQAVQGKLTRAQLEGWIKRLSAKDRSGAGAVEAELEALRAAAVGVGSPSADLPSTGRPSTSRSGTSTPAPNKRARPERVISLVSRGDHKRALTTARDYGLHPMPVPQPALKPGQSPDAHTVQAVEGVASKLIVTGNWKTAE